VNDLGELEESRVMTDAEVPATTDADVPLVVDLDGTLIRTDMLHETASSHVFGSPLAAPRIAGWLLRGRSHLKSRLAAQAVVEFADLPYRSDLLAWLADERSTGRRIVLATASHQSLADGIAQHLGIFDEVLSTDETTNLKSAAKRDRLVERFGDRGYDYVGNSRTDVAVWATARTAHVVGGPRLVTRAGEVTEVGRVFADEPSGVRDVVRAFRPHQWVKNFLVLVPLFTAQRFGDRADVIAAVVALASFCIAASSVYILNDIADLANDRNHPIKRLRPFAAGRLSVVTGWFLWPALVVVALALAMTVNWTFFATLLTYLVITLAYTFWAKRRPVLDVVSLGLLYTIRIIAGAAAIQAPLSMWLLTFSMLLFLSLALIKRVSELTRARAELKETRGRGYRDSDLELLSSYGVASSIGAVVIFSLYVNDPTTAKLYQSPDVLWATVPVLLAWLMRCWLLAHRGEMNEDPIVFAIRDRVSILCGLLVALTFVAAALVPR